MPLQKARRTDLTRRDGRWKVSVVSDTAREKKSMARRSTGLDYSSACPTEHTGCTHS